MQETECLIRDFWERRCKKEEARAVHVVYAGAKACLAFKPFEEGLDDAVKPQEAEPPKEETP